MRSGAVIISYGIMFYVGNEGYGWSSRGNSTTAAYRLGLNTGMYPSTADNRYLGRSLRCLSTV